MNPTTGKVTQEEAQDLLIEILIQNNKITSRRLE